MMMLPCGLLEATVSSQDALYLESALEKRREDARNKAAPDAVGMRTAGFRNADVTPPPSSPGPPSAYAVDVHANANQMDPMDNGSNLPDGDASEDASDESGESYSFADMAPHADAVPDAEDTSRSDSAEPEDEDEDEEEESDSEDDDNLISIQ